MNKVKVLQSSSITVLERKINEYLKDYQDYSINVQHSSVQILRGQIIEPSYSATIHISSVNIPKQDEG
ncbi:hypothetical protein [Pedobacter sp. Leaf250]|uniref:hypothetical protein n=1 Tax=Pedobacter sp. Leaf250 TaxID=2876559 RepID=UPI001E5CE403|nr:hypothetical protein [Pedobacter sp. Leaf250]